jgi:uncharacterized protein involved in response to NO
VQPFRLFFLLAAVDAIVAVGLWLPKFIGVTAWNVAGVPIALWHRDELLFGMIPAVLAGFVLTALPRWTRQLAVPPPALRLLAVLWVIGRVAHFAPGESPQVWAPGIAAVFIVTLALIAARQVLGSCAWREAKIVLLLFGFAMSAGLASLQPDGSTGTTMRLGLACVLGLVIVLGGRITPALTANWLEARGASLLDPRQRWIEAIAALSVAAALCAWVIAPKAEFAVVTSVCACVTQTARLVRWQGWRVVDSASICALHAAYGWIPVGFALHAAAVVWPSVVREAGVVHAWSLGAIGLMSVAVMASMIRRHSRTPFAFSALMSASLACAVVTAPARIIAELVSSERTFWLLLSAISWVAAFLLFLLAFREPLLQHAHRRSAPF